MSKAAKFYAMVVALSLTACAGFQRSCSSTCASGLGADWIIVQYRMDGEVVACWRLDDVSVENESNSDGVYWQGSDGHLVHISGWYNRVQVEGGDWSGAAEAIGVDLSSCRGGKYATPEVGK